ncbi:hypothetical protein OPV22_033246 [Ensete ventricosum]|uniref:Large ribosomal subunit protein bL9c n=1 Tax=Ensete ventricosum TaxID=4639 RepID=A0AAV8PZK0_ENSVE|nr:hypothetical protein OPV22_033246 [Ensete ventricosum]
MEWLQPYPVTRFGHDPIRYQAYPSPYHRTRSIQEFRSDPNEATPHDRYKQKEIRRDPERRRRGIEGTAMASTLSWGSVCCPRPHRVGGGSRNEGPRKPVEAGRVMPILAQKKAKKIRKIILKENVTELGKKGDLLDVKAGYYRNFLLPTGKAQLVTSLLLKEMRIEEERIEAEKQRVKEEAQQLALIFQTVGAFKVKRKGGKGKQIFGTVTAQDLVDIIKAQLNRDVDKRIVTVPEIRETGEYIETGEQNPSFKRKNR